ncbi:MAG: hypothetical protein JWP69_1333 [Flaviaesturariibacter sp.]|nr:hypothetical protein [Flaviaesturariibacter sp.]
MRVKSSFLTLAKRIKKIEMENRINITENAYFYLIHRPVSRRLIDRLITEATDHKNGNFVYKNIREVQSERGKTFTTTFVVFKYLSYPSFLTRGTEKEIKYGYLLLIEYGSYLIVSKRGTNDFSKLLDLYVSELPYETLAKFRVSADTLFKKLSVSSVEVSKNVVRRQQVEADDIKGIYSTVTSSSKVVNSVRLKNTDHETAIAVSTSRINQFGKKAVFAGFCWWVAEICDAIDSYVPATNFIDNFAEPLPFATTITSLTPVSMLFNLYQLADDISTGVVDKIIYNSRNGNSRELSIASLLELNDHCHAVNPTADPKVFRIENKTDKSLRLRINPKSIELQSSKLGRIDICYATGEVQNLRSYISKEGLFLVAFNNSEIRYTAKALYRDSKLLGNIDYFLNFIHTEAFLATATSEKGSITPASAAFDPTCLFAMIESNLATDCDYLMCDDLGDEWADYIGFRKNNFIRFYHAKASDKIFSASAFHDLVAQALKNIGHFDFNKDLTAKQASITNPYSNCGINRLRKGDTVANCMRYLKETYNSPNVEKEVVLVINFLSKARLTTELTNLKSGAATARQTIQLLWQLSTLICACIEKGVKLKIITKP